MNTSPKFGTLNFCIQMIKILQINSINPAIITFGISSKSIRLKKIIFKEEYERFFGVSLKWNDMIRTIINSYSRVGQKLEEIRSVTLLKVAGRRFGQTVVKHKRVV